MSPSNPLPTSQVAVNFTIPDPYNAHLNQTAPVPTIPKSGTYTLVRVNYASLNPVDYKMGSMPSPIARLVVGASPIVPAADFAGRVWATNHPSLKPGDRVWGALAQPVHRGSCAQYMMIKGTTNISKVPNGWNRGLDQLGVVGIAGFTALQILMQGDLPFSKSKGQEKGGRVFINGGSGGVGSYAVQIAKHGMGCESVVSTCSGANLDLVKSLGADEVIDYRSMSVTEGLKQWSRKNGGQKFDVIIDCVGSDQSIYWESPHYLKEGGRYLQIGADINSRTVVAIFKIVAWPTILGGGKTPFKFYSLGPIKQEEFDMLGAWMVEGKVKSVIEEDNRFELGEVAKAFQKLKGGRTRGKMVIEVDREGQ